MNSEKVSHGCAANERDYGALIDPLAAVLLTVCRIVTLAWLVEFRPLSAASFNSATSSTPPHLSIPMH